MWLGSFVQPSQTSCTSLTSRPSSRCSEKKCGLPAPGNTASSAISPARPVVRVVVVAVLEEPRGGVAPRARSRRAPRGSGGSTASRTSCVFSSSPSWMPRIRDAREAHDRGGGLRLEQAGRGELGTILRRVARAAVAVREDQQMHLPAGGDPFRQRAAGRDLGVVGMRVDAEHRAGASGRSDRRPRHAAVSRSGPGRSGRACAPGRRCRPSDRGRSPCSAHAGPAMSRCTHGVSPTNSARNSAAVIAPPHRSPMFFTSATVESISRR